MQRCVQVIIVLAVFGCETSPSLTPVTVPDAQVSMDAGELAPDMETTPPAVDASVMVDMAVAALGEPCESNGQCASGFCLQLGDDASVCGQECVEEACPDGWFCAEVHQEMTQWCVPEDRCVDFDGDGAGQGEVCPIQDCDDGNGEIHPGVMETCDGIDNDCDERSDEEIAGEGDDCETGVPGICEAGWQSCQLGEAQCIQREEPAEEVCNRIDDDCDGTIDEAIERNCGTDVGACEFGVEVCTGGEWSLCRNALEPSAETCNGVDDDCDGVTDDVAAIPEQVLRIEDWGEDSYLGAAEDGRHYAVVRFEEDGVNLLFKLIDAEENRVVNTSSALAYSGTTRRGTPLLDDAEIFAHANGWWVVYVVRYRDDPFGGAIESFYQVSFLRFNAAGEPIGDFVLVEDDAREYEADALGERLGIRIHRTIREYGIDGASLRSFELTRPGGGWGQYVSMSATPEGWMMAFNAQLRHRVRETRTQRWVDGEPVGEAFEVRHDEWAEVDRKYDLVRTEDGFRLLEGIDYMDPVRGAWHITPIADDGRIGEKRVILEDAPISEHGDRQNQWFSRSHGQMGGLLFAEDIQHPVNFRSRLFYYSRTNLDGELLLSREVFVGDNRENMVPTLGNFQTAGPGPDIAFMWSSGADLKFARSGLSACVAPAQ